MYEIGWQIGGEYYHIKTGVFSLTSPLPALPALPALSALPLSPPPALSTPSIHALLRFRCTNIGLVGFWINYGITQV